MPLKRRNSGALPELFNNKGSVWLAVPMKLSRRRFSALTLGSLALGSLAEACTPRQAADSKLVFWTMQLQPTFTDFIGERLAVFTAETGIVVQWVDVPWADMESKILTAMAANNAPDLANLNPSFAAKLAERNTLLDVWPCLSDRDRDAYAYYPRLWQANQWQNTTFGIPWYVTTDITFYNQPLLEAAGLSQPPRTFIELAQAAAQIKAATGKYAFLLTMDGSQVLEAMVQMGLELLNTEGSVAYATPAAEAIFQYWVDLFQNGLITP